MSENQNDMLEVVDNQSGNKDPGRMAKAAARASLKGRWGKAAVISLQFVLTMIPFIIFYGLFIAVSVASGSDDSTGDFVNRCMFGGGAGLLTFLGLFLLFYVLMLAYIYVIVPVLTYSFYRCAPMFADKNMTLSAKEFWKGFKFFGRGLGLFWWNALWLFLWELAGIGIGAVIGFVLGLATNASVAGLFIPVIVFGFVIWKSYSYSMAFFIAVDYPNIPVTQTLNASKVVTEDSKFYLFCFDLSFIGWYLLCILSLGIGMLWLAPYYVTSKYNLFRTMVPSSITNFERKFPEVAQLNAPSENLSKEQE